MNIPIKMTLISPSYFMISHCIQFYPQLNPSHEPSPPASSAPRDLPGLVNINKKRWWKSWCYSWVNQRFLWANYGKWKKIWPCFSSVNLRFLWAIFKFANCDKLPEGKVNIPLGQKVLSGFNHPFGGAGFQDVATIHNLVLKYRPPKKTHNT
jgi:hypothetical protein